MLGWAVAAAAAAAAAPIQSPVCVYNAGSKYSARATGVFVKPCTATDATQRWGGATLTAGDSPSALTNEGAPAGSCLGASSVDPVSMETPCGAASRGRRCH